MKIAVITTLDSFETLEPAWKRLTEGSDSDKPLITYEFLYSLLKVFFEKHKLLVFVVKEGDQGDKIAPFVRDGKSVRARSVLTQKRIVGNEKMASASTKFLPRGRER